MGNELKVSSKPWLSSTAQLSVASYFPLLLEDSFPGPLPTQDFAFSPHCEAKL